MPNKTGKSPCGMKIISYGIIIATDRNERFFHGLKVIIFYDSFSFQLVFKTFSLRLAVYAFLYLSSALVYLWYPEVHSQYVEEYRDLRPALERICN